MLPVPIIVILQTTAKMDTRPLPRFSHTPPSKVTGRARWPLSLEYQAFPWNEKPILRDVLIWVTPYLEQQDIPNVKNIAKEYKLGPEYGPLYFYRPWSPHHRRRWGFGIPKKERTVVNDIPPPHLCIHFIWQFLSPTDRYSMTRACSQWFLYHKLCVLAVCLPISSLRLRRPPPGKPNTSQWI